MQNLRDTGPDTANLHQFTTGHGSAAGFAVGSDAVRTVQAPTPRLGRSVADLLTTAVDRFAAKPAMDFLGKRWTYAELGALVDRAAAGLQTMGVVRGDRIGLCLPNTPYSLIFYFAILRIGGTVVNYNPLYVARELSHQIKDSGTTVMITIDIADIHAKLVTIAAASGLRKIVLCPLADALPFAKATLYRLLKRKERVRRVPRDALHVTYDQVMANTGAPAPVIIDPDRDIAVLQYTGGTTGTPKGAMLTHANVVANCDQIDEFSAVLDPPLRQGQERMMAVLPLFHVFAMTVVMNSGVVMGAEIILLPRFVLRQCLKALVRRKATVFPAVPTIYAAIAKEAEKVRCDLSSIRLCFSGGAPLPGDVRHKFETMTGCRLVEGYGLTETSPVVCCSPAAGNTREGSVGLPMPGTVIEIRDPATGKRLTKPGEKGEILVRGPQVMRGYWNKPADTAAVFDDGALCTGDIGYLDADGYLFIVDRIKDVILCGGFNVYPRVLEEALYQHPAVIEATVIGLPDEYRGQVPKAYVVLREGHSVTGEELRAFMGDYVSRIELPKTVEIRTSLPKTFIGKLSRKELIEEEALKAKAAAS